MMMTNTADMTRVDQAVMWKHASVMMGTGASRAEPPAPKRKVRKPRK